MTNITEVLSEKPKVIHIGEYKTTEELERLKKSVACSATETGLLVF